jgi:hypothetical protein
MVSGIEKGRNDADKLTWVPGETLAGGEVGDQSRRSVRLSDVDHCGFLFGDGRTEEARSTVLEQRTLERR